MHAIFTLLLLPLHLATRLIGGLLSLHFLGFIVVAGLGVWVFTNWQSAPNGATQKEIQQAPTLEITYLDALPPLPEQITEGNSRFSKSLREQLSPTQYKAYNQVYHDIMQQPEPTERIWKAGTQIFGQIKTSKLFTSPSKVQCRSFAEVVAFTPPQQALQAQRFSGYACQKISNTSKKVIGWCTLNINSALTCDIIRPTGLDGLKVNGNNALRSIGNSLGGLF